MGELGCVRIPRPLLEWRIANPSHPGLRQDRSEDYMRRVVTHLSSKGHLKQLSSRTAAYDGGLHPG